MMMMMIDDRHQVLNLVTFRRVSNLLICYSITSVLEFIMFPLIFMWLVGLVYPITIVIGMVYPITLSHRLGVPYDPYHRYGVPYHLCHMIIIDIMLLHVLYILLLLPITFPSYSFHILVMSPIELPHPFHSPSPSIDTMDTLEFESDLPHW